MLTQLVMGAAAAQRFTFSESSLLSLFESLVNPALLRRRADQDLWARCSRVRLRLRMPYSSVCSGVLRVLAAGTGNSRSLRRLLSKQAPSKGPNLRPRIARFGYSSSGELPLKVGTGPLASEMLRFDIHKFSHFRQNCPQGYWVASAPGTFASSLSCDFNKFNSYAHDRDKIR